MDGEASSTSAVSAGPPPPATDTAWAVATARDVLARGYGIAAGTVVRLGGEIDVNLAVSGTDGQRVVVKIGAPGTDLAHLHWQHDLLDALDGRPDLPPVPRILRAADGSAVTLVDDIGGRRPVRVQTWLPGRTLAELDHHSPELLRDWGRAAAQLVAALPADPPPGVPATHHWEAVRAREAVDSQLWAVRDASRRADVEVIMARFDTHVAPVLDDLPRQVVHQDLNDFNVLASPGPDRRHRLSGVLDFTDAIHTARVSRHWPSRSV